MTARSSRAAASGLLAALAGVLVLSAGAALAGALDAPVAAWLVPAAVPAACGLAAAALTRWLGGRTVQPLLAGLAVAAVAWCLQWWPETLLVGLAPQPATAAAIAESADRLRQVIWTETAPVDPSPPVVAGVGALLAVTALVTDAVAVGLRSPALAGLPALAFVGGAGVLTTGVAPWPALALAAAAWLGLLAVGREEVLDRVLDRAHRPGAASGTWPAGAAVAGTAAVAALVIAATQLPLLSSGLAPEGRRVVLGPGSGPVDPAADLGRELRSGTGYAGIRYETEDGRGVYLRTAVVDDVYDAPWEASPPGPGAPGRTVPELEPAGVRLAGGAGRLRSGSGPPRSEVRLVLEGWSGHWAPLPDQSWMVDGPLGQRGWTLDPATASAYRPAAEPVGLAYRAAVVPVRLGLADLAARAAPGAPPEVAGRWGPAPELAGSALQDLARRVTAGRTGPVEQAAAIQSYLTSRRFSYSETAPAEEGYDGSGLEMTEQFLRTGAGYCIHYASAMAMMAHAVGIPARVVVGYAPVAARGGEHRVTSDRAHSWPELYLGGVGWVPFEPTPGVGRTPPYGQLAAGPRGPVEDPVIGDPPAAAGDAPTASPEPPDGTAEQGPAAGDGNAAGATGRLAAGAVLLAALAGVAALPRALRTRRRRLRLGARPRVRGPGPGRHAEALRAAVGSAWRELEDTAVDLRRGRAPAESEPALGRRLARAAGGGEPHRAVPGRGDGGGDPDPGATADRIVDAVVWARYAPPDAPPPADAGRTTERVATLVAGLEAAAEPAVRRRARWLPASLLPRASRAPATARAPGRVASAGPGEPAPGDPGSATTRHRSGASRSDAPRR
ncbi:transglutaminase domain-containing protein [Citricoccus sp. SGAir0253]|uniref:transglutaminase-like domain-containing protein n=1 Tax=Citricoccus sp. SGAir0253 TaxID=2567881 RepID=UPI0010CD69E1|nr:transglutaminase-like domain-containing protein [Citricoccus sp. SGAir0253]QCU78633.1 transglutaminase domain-containing protein [Citricoccus sp. SGAir0253]